MFVFRKIWCAFFSLNTRFEIRPFALLPTTERVIQQTYLKFATNTSHNRLRSGQSLHQFNSFLLTLTDTLVFLLSF